MVGGNRCSVTDWSGRSATRVTLGWSAPAHRGRGGSRGSRSWMCVCVRARTCTWATVLRVGFGRGGHGGDQFLKEKKMVSALQIEGCANDTGSPSTSFPSPWRAPGVKLSHQRIGLKSDDKWLFGKMEIAPTFVIVGFFRPQRFSLIWSFLRLSQSQLNWS